MDLGIEGYTLVALAAGVVGGVIAFIIVTGLIGFIAGCAFTLSAERKDEERRDALNEIG